MLISQNLKRSLYQNNYSTSLQLINKFQQILKYARNTNNTNNNNNVEEKYKIIINVLFV